MAWSEYINSKEYKDYLEYLDKSLNLYELESKEVFESLPYEAQLKTFFHVVKTIYQAELIDKCTYRTVLYEKFNFDIDSYTIGMDCGYMEIHNSIYTYEDIIEGIVKIIKAFKNNNELSSHDLYNVFVYGKNYKSDFMQLKLDFGEN